MPNLHQKVTNLRAELLSETAAVGGGANFLGTFILSSLPPSPTSGSVAYVSNGRKIAEAAASGTGVLAYYSGGSWRVLSSDQPVTS